MKEKLYIILEYLNMSACFISSILLTVEFDTPIPVTILISFITVLLIAYNPLPFINEVILIIAYIISYYEHNGFYLITLIVLSLTGVLWAIQLVILIKNYLQNTNKNTYNGE